MRRGNQASLLRLLRLAPELDPQDHPGGLGKSVCDEARRQFGADAALLVSLTESRHTRVEWREPPSSLLPPGRTFHLDELPHLGNAIRDAEVLFDPGPIEQGASEDAASLTSLPVVIRGRTRRLLFLQWTEPIVTPDAETLLGLRLFADDAGLAFEQLERGRVEAASRRNAEQTQRLLDLGNALSAAGTIGEVVAAARNQGRLGADADVVTVYMVEGDTIGPAAIDASTGEPAPARAETVSPAVADAVRLRELVLIESLQACIERYPTLATTLRDKGFAAAASVPLTVGDASVGAVELSFVAPKRFSLEERQFLAAIGRQGGIALRHAWLRASERSISLRLQRQLLPLRLPKLPGLRTGAEYRPGAAQLEAGGDWYDVFSLGPTRVAVTVGDVVGKGVAAAGVMGRLRSALRALAIACDDPNHVVAYLERFAETIDGADFATLCYADLDLTSGVLRYLSAGHMPLLLVSPRGTARFVEDGRRTPLCVPLPDPGSHARLTLEPGATVVLYSDGLVERRHRSLDDGLRLLKQQAASLTALAPDEFARELADQMTAGDDVDDDVVVLVVRFEGPTVVA